MLVGLVASLSLPIDRVPDFIPEARALDDEIFVAMGLRTVFRRAGRVVEQEHLPGPKPSLDVMLRLGRVAHDFPLAAAGRLGSRGMLERDDVFSLVLRPAEGSWAVTSFWTGA